MNYVNMLLANALNNMVLSGTGVLCMDKDFTLPGYTIKSLEDFSREEQLEALRKQWRVTDFSAFKRATYVEAFASLGVTVNAKGRRV